MDERVVGGRVAGNGFDGPRVARAQSRFLRRNADQARRTSGERAGKGSAMANKWRTSGTVNPASSSVAELFFPAPAA